jgi:hypothetical protein
MGVSCEIDSKIREQEREKIKWGKKEQSCGSCVSVTNELIFMFYGVPNLDQ